MSKSLDWDQARHFVVGPDLGPICLQKLSADDTSKQRVDNTHTGKGQSKTLILLTNIDKKSLEKVIDCHLSPV